MPDASFTFDRSVVLWMRRLLVGLATAASGSAHQKPGSRTAPTYRPSRKQHAGLIRLHDEESRDQRHGDGHAGDQQAAAPARTGHDAGERGQGKGGEEPEQRPAVDRSSGAFTGSDRQIRNRSR